MGKSTAAIFVLVIVSGVLAGFLSVQELWISYSIWIVGCLAIVAAAIVMISYRISLRIYVKKEF